MDREMDLALVRIGELSRRVGVSEYVLRAWESRYGLLRPARSTGGYRLYSEQDQNRVRRMQVHLAEGLAAAEAARAALAEEQPGRGGPGRGGPGSGGSGPVSPDRFSPGPSGAALRAGSDPADGAENLRRALDELDEPGAQSVLDRLLADFTVEVVLRDVLLPYLHDLGQRWDSGEISVAQEHFASHVVRGRLAGLARGWGYGDGPQSLLACPPGEHHDLALIVFGIVLNRNGWRVGFLGANTPIEDAIQLTTATRPSLVVLAATTPELFARVEPELSRLAGMATLALAGEGATLRLADKVGARLLTQDAVTAAESLPPARTWA